MKQCPNCFSQAKDTDLRCPSCGSIINKSTQPNKHRRFDQDTLTANKSRVFILAVLILLIAVSSAVFYVNSVTPKLSDFGFVQSETDPTHYSATTKTFTYLLDTDEDMLCIESRIGQSTETIILVPQENLISYVFEDISNSDKKINCDLYCDFSDTYIRISSCLYLSVDGVDIFPYRFSKDMKSILDTIFITADTNIDLFDQYLNKQDDDPIFIQTFIELNK